MIDLSIILEQKTIIERQFPNVIIWQTDYIGVTAGGDIYSDLLTIKDNMQSITLVISLYKYQYVVKTMPDNSFFIRFIYANEVKDYYEQNGWKFVFDIPLIQGNRTYNNRRCSFVGPNDIKNSVFVNVAKAEEIIPKLLKYFTLAQKCTTQYELDLLLENYRKDNLIEELSMLLKNMRNGTI